MTWPTAQAQTSNARLFTRIAPVALCFAFALLTVSTASTLTMQSTFLDPYVYAGYVNDYVGTFRRYGHTYYSSRIAYIFLDRAFISAFGQELGLFLCRLLVLGAAAYASFRIALRYYGFSVGVIAAAWLCFVPWLLRSISWTHYDGFATAYLIIALAFLIASHRHHYAGHFAAGFFFALAVNCNLHLLLIGGAFAPSWLILNRRHDLRTIIFLTIAFCGGFVAGYGALQIIFSITIGNYRLFIEQAAINSARSLLGGQMSNWFTSIDKIVYSGVIIFLLPLFFIIGGIVTTIVNWSSLAPQRKDFAISATLYAALLNFAVFVLHFRGHGWLSLFYYEVYLLPSCLLVLVSVAGISSARHPRLASIVCVGAAALLAASWLTRYSTNFAVSNDIRIWFAIAAATTGIALLRPRLFSGTVFLIGLTGATYGMFMWQPGVAGYYSTWPGLVPVRERESSVYFGAVFLQDFVKKYVPATSQVGFWYDSKPENVNFNSMQSMFLWGYSRLQGFTGPAMPVVDDHFRTAIKPKAFIVIIARTDSEIDTAMSALKDVPVNYREIARAQYTAPVEGYHVAIAELASTPGQLGSQLGEIPLQSITPAAGSVATPASGQLELTTPQCVWCYGATITLDQKQHEESSNITVRATLVVGEGQLGIGFAPADNISNIQNIVSASERGIEQTIDVKLPTLRNTILVLRNESPRGASRASIKSIQYFNSKQGE